MNDLERYLDEYRKRSEQLLEKTKSLNSDISIFWKELEINLYKECLTLFDLLGQDIDSMLESPDLRDKFIKRIEKIEKELLQKLLNYKNIYEKSYNDIIQDFILFRKRFLDTYIEKNKSYKIKIELLEESFNKINFLLEKESDLKNITSNKYTSINIEFKEFNIFAKQEDMKEIQLSYAKLSRTYEDILQRKIILNKIKYLESIKMYINNKMGEVMEKKRKLTSVKTYEEVSNYIKENYTSYSSELQKYINIDVEIIGTLKYGVSQFGSDTENRVLNIYRKRYQKNVLDLKSMSEDFIKTRDGLLEIDYRKIVVQSYTKFLKLERENYKKVKSEGDKILATDDLRKMNIYLRDTFVVSSSFIRTSYDRILRALNKRADININLIEVKGIFEKIELKVMKELYNQRLEEESYSYFREEYIRGFKIAIGRSLNQDEKDLIGKLSLIHKRNIDEIKSLEVIKNLNLNVDLDLEIQKIKDLEKKIQTNYDFIYGEYKVKQDKYVQILFPSKISLDDLEAKKSIYQKTEKEIFEKYIQCIEDKKKEKEAIITEYNKKFSISLEKAKNDSGLSKELERFKKYKITLPKVKNVELFIKEQEKIKNIEIKGIITNMKMKLYLNINKVIDYEGLKDD